MLRLPSIYRALVISFCIYIAYHLVSVYHYSELRKGEPIQNADAQKLASFTKNARVATASDEGTNREAAPESQNDAGTEEEPETNEGNEDNDGNEKLNILLLYADDWRHDTLGAAGNPVVKTPVLDNLARRGIRFTHNCVTTSVCWISRVTLWTGQYMSRHKTVGLNDTAFLSYWNETFPALLRRHGYHTGLVGKWHLRSPPVANKWDFARLYAGKHYYRRPSHTGPWYHVTELNEMDATTFLKQRPRDKPFFLKVAFYATHAEDGNPLQYLPQNASMGLYRNVTVPRAKTHTREAWRLLPDFITPQNPGRIRYNMRHNETNKHQRMMKNFYRMATEVDTSCGRLMKLLGRQGVLNNTLVIFTTDNGLFQGEHGLADKWYPHEESIRVPLIIKDPRMPKEKIGTVDDNFVLNIDLAPTILSAAGIDIPERMQGRDISQLYYHPDATTNGDSREQGGGKVKEEVGEWRNEFFYEHPKIPPPVLARQMAAMKAKQFQRAVKQMASMKAKQMKMAAKQTIPASEALVRKEFKYFYWPDYKVEQLFHVGGGDPYEEVDLVNNPQYSDIMTEMRERHRQLKEMVV